MSDRFLHGRGVNGIAYEAERLETDRNDAVVMLKVPLAWLKADATAELAAFLLAAAGPDAAREALAKLAPGCEIGECDACEKTTLLTPTGKAGAVSICAPCLETSYQEHTASMAEQMAALSARAILAEKRLASVLALTPGEIADAWYTSRQYNGVLALIRSRATEGAEEPTGATT